jgi:hypothetical protein
MAHIPSETPISICLPTAAEKKAELKAKLKKISKIAFIVLLTLVMTLTQPPILIGGVILGLLFSKKIGKVFDRINSLWQKHHFKMIGVGILCAVIAAPVVFITTAALTGSYLGMRLTK